MAFVKLMGGIVRVTILYFVANVEPTRMLHSGDRVPRAVWALLLFDPHSPVLTPSRISSRPAEAWLEFVNTHTTPATC